MKGHGSNDDMPDGNERCRECHEQYCDAYDMGDPVHEKCVENPGEGSRVKLPEIRRPKKIVRWGLKSPEGWFVEGERGLFTHTSDVRMATSYKTRTAAQKAVHRAKHSVEVGAVTYERIRVSDPNDGPGEIRCFGCGHVRETEKKFPTINELWKVLEASGWVELEEKALVHCADCARKKVRWFVLREKCTGAHGSFNEWLVEGERGLFRGVGTKEEASRYSTYEDARGALTRAKHSVGGEVKIDHFYEPVREPDARAKRRWAIRFPHSRGWAVLGGAGVPTRTAESVEKATLFSGPVAAEAWAEREGGDAVEVTAELYEGKRSEPYLPPSREPFASQGPSVPLHWVVEKVIDGKAHFLKESAKGKKPIFAKEVENATKFCSSVHARGAAKKIAGGREAPIYMTVKKWEPRNGDLVRFDHLEEGDRSCGTGVVQATGLTSKDGKTVRVRWSRSSTPGRMNDRDEIMFHEPGELRPLTDAEERMLEDEARAKPIFEAILHELPEDPKVRLPLTVLKGLKLMRRTIRKLRELDNESEEPRRLKWDSAEDRRAVLRASLWIRSISKAIVKPKKRKKEKLRERNRGAYHDMLERAMDETKQGKGFLPRFVELIHEDMIDLGPTESGR